MTKGRVVVITNVVLGELRLDVNIQKWDVLQDGSNISFKPQQVYSPSNRHSVFFL